LRAQSSKVMFVWVVGATLGFAAYAHHRHPLDEWLTLFWARAWLCVSLFGFASLAIGLTILALLKVHAGSFLERTSVALAAGVLTFALGIFVAGLAGFLGLPFFFAWPALLIWLGRRALRRYFCGLSRQWSRFGAALFFPQNLAQALAALAIVAGAFALYVQVLAPSSIGFDARWYHVPIAESYAAAGRIRPFPEGWYLGAYPHLASWLYTWAFLAPGVLKHHLCLASHLEFALLLVTVGSTSALASRLIAGARLRHGGAALFLFPAIFNISSNLGLGADHVLALWAAPMALALLRYLAKADVRHGALLGMLLGGAILTKYQAVYFVAAIGLVLAIDLARQRQLRPLLTAAGVTLVVSSPFWLKNWIAYGDPFYPNLFRWLPDRPFYPGAAEHFDRAYWFSGATVSLSGMQRVRDTLRALGRFSFFPMAWARASDDATVVGSLFTLLLPLMLWVRPRWRVLLIAGCVHLALVVWWLTYPYDRYLQAFMPWMAACVAATLAAVWRTRAVALRAALVMLVGLQIVWGGDSYLLRSQEMLAALPLRALGAAADEHPFARNPYPGEELSEVGARLPKGARLVGHDFYQSLGVGAPAITDNPDWQGSIEYLQIDQPEEVRRRWRALGGTHLLWPFSKETRPPEDLARDTVFGRASVAFTNSSFTVAGYRVAELVDRPAPKSMQNRTLIAWLGCGTDRSLGVYTPAGLASGTLDRPLSKDQLEREPSLALAEINTLWFKWDCEDSRAALEVVSHQFTKVMVTGNFELWVRIPLDAPGVRAP
jgi:dolichyl-phosphate-mannose-protein mannosyltransferase